MPKFKTTLEEMTNVDVQFISMVYKPASKIPFRVTKSDEKADDMINFNKMFRAKADSANVPSVPTIMALVVKAEKLDAALAKAELEGLKIDDVEITEGIAVIKQDGYIKDDEDSAVLKMSEDAGLLVSHIKKGFSSYADGTNFAENLKQQGFMPSLYIATDVMEDTIRSVLYESADGADAAEKIRIIMSEYTSYVMALVADIPTVAFKFDGSTFEDNKVEVVKDEAGGEDVGTDTIDVDTVAATIDPEKAKDAVAETVVKADDESTNEPTDDADIAAKEVVAKSEETSLDSVLNVFKSELASMKESLSGEINTLKEELTSKVSEVETVAKSAQDAVTNTVQSNAIAGDSENTNAQGTAKKSDDLWDGVLDDLDTE